MDLRQLGEMLGSIWTIGSIVIFIGIVAWAWSARNRRRFERDARIPFKEKD